MFLRFPLEVGGLYFISNLVLSQVSVVVCVFLYISYYEDEEDRDDTQPDVVTLHNETIANSTGTKFAEEQLLMIVGGLLATFSISFTLFLAKIERKYVKTFFSMETAHELAKRLFLEGENDYEKGRILKGNRYMWSSIRPQVAEWLDANWDKWEDEKPDWFDAVFLDAVDDDIMPARALAKEKQKTGGGPRRRSSFLERLSVRVGDEIEGGGGDEESGVASLS